MGGKDKMWLQLSGDFTESQEAFKKKVRHVRNLFCCVEKIDRVAMSEILPFRCKVTINHELYNQHKEELKDFYGSQLGRIQAARVLSDKSIRSQLGLDADVDLTSEDVVDVWKRQGVTSCGECITYEYYTKVKAMEKRKKELDRFYHLWLKSGKGDYIPLTSESLPYVLLDEGYTLLSVEMRSDSEVYNIFTNTYLRVLLMLCDTDDELKPVNYFKQNRTWFAILCPNEKADWLHGAMVKQFIKGCDTFQNSRKGLGDMYLDIGRYKDVGTEKEKRDWNILCVGDIEHLRNTYTKCNETYKGLDVYR
ncbi:MAG: hypothetical protein ACI35P_06555 [Bacillus sp. (in: firmicutes)]